MRTNEVSCTYLKELELLVSKQQKNMKDMESMLSILQMSLSEFVRSRGYIDSSSDNDSDSDSDSDGDGDSEY